MSKQDKVICLGKEFNSEEERRDYFRNELRVKLPELKKIEGFPIGEDEDIINLSDPPYYTACPNPWLNDFIAEWEKEKESIPGRKKDFHVVEPYASDVSEGKSAPIYLAHSYHTKVPHQAIMRYIMFFTQPGDIILDGFGGTGMTGVAASFCDNPTPEFKYLLEKEFHSKGHNNINWGKRNCVLNDLSPVASFIARNYNSPFDSEEFTELCSKLLSEFDKELGVLYQTKHNNGNLGRVNYFVWSDVFLCSTCNSEILFWTTDENENMDEIICSKCKAIHTKRNIEKKIETKFDLYLGQVISMPKREIVLINYTYQGKNYEKSPDSYDLEIQSKAENEKSKYWVPIKKMMGIGEKWGDTWRAGTHLGITHVHHFYSNRALIALSYLYDKVSTFNNKGNFIIQFFVEQAVLGMAKISRYVPSHYSQVNQYLSGTLYIGSQTVDVHPRYILDGKLKRLPKALAPLKSYQTISNQSATDFRNIKDNSIDYIFVDPPFGANLMYSELNYLWESWQKLETNIGFEAIESKSQNKTLLEYQELMTKAFWEHFRILKPGKWMTVEFSNTSAAVWNGIQTALQRAGFVIANVAGLDKKQGSFKAVTSPTAVKQDLVISCYKPTSEFESQFKAQHGEVAVWDFVTQHLHHLPAHIRKDNSTTAIVERSPKILYDRLITFYLMRGLPVPIDAKDFQDGLKQRFVDRDGMYFTAEQAAEYDEKKAKAPQFVQLSLIVTNESDAIEWLKDRLRKQAQKYQDIMPDFRIATQSLRKGDTLPELQDILNENFIQESDGSWRTPDPNEAKDRDALRTKVLLKEFNGYVTAISQPRAKKLKEVRVEALRAGFKNCWEQKEFKTIVTLGDMIPQNILLEDEQLLMYYDIAKDRV